MKVSLKYVHLDLMYAESLENMCKKCRTPGMRLCNCEMKFEMSGDIKVSVPLHRVVVQYFSYEKKYVKVISSQITFNKKGFKISSVKSIFSKFTVILFRERNSLSNFTV